MRIVSLVPSATEIVAALGLVQDLVGISADCDYPLEILGTPVLSVGVAGPDLSSPAIDRRIRRHVHAGRSVYDLDGDLLRRCRPDLILTQQLCDVCAPSYTLVSRAAHVCDGSVRIVSLEPHGLDEILETILLVGDLTGRRDDAEALVEGLRRRIDEVAARPRGCIPRVACLDWLDPVFAAGHWVPEMVRAAGGSDALGTPGAPSRAVAWDDVVAAQPDVLVLAPCGFDVRRTRTEIGLLTSRRGWDDLPAVRAGRVFLTDASSYFNRPGPRIVDGLEILAGIIHPGGGVPEPPRGSVEPLHA